MANKFRLITLFFLLTFIVSSIGYSTEHNSCQEVCKIKKHELDHNDYLSTKCSIHEQVACTGDDCIRTCEDYDKFLEPDMVYCDKDDYDNARCFHSSCVPCDRARLPENLQDERKPTGVGLLCKADRVTPCCQEDSPDPYGNGCIIVSNSANYNE